MKILAVRGRGVQGPLGLLHPDKLEGVELIIACGDLSRHYLEYLATMAPVPLLYVHGNHDESYDPARRRGSSALMTRSMSTTACGSPGWAAAAATAPAPGSLPRPR